MFARTVKKAIGFLIVDAVLIIGIFVLQFSNDSIINEKLGNLQISLTESNNETGDGVLLNNLQISFNGVTFSSDNTKPALVQKIGVEEKQPVKLLSWNKNNMTYEFMFSEGVSFFVELEGLAEKSGISISTKLPEDVEDFFIPYSLESNIEIMQNTKSKLLIGNKKTTWEFSAPSVAEQYVMLTSKIPTATYAYYEKPVEFNFSVLAQAETLSNYNNVVASFRKNLISAFKSNIQESISNEEAIVAYIAEMASNGNYVAAIDEIPQSFKRSVQRTYLSAPYFGSLSEMNSSLSKAVSEKQNLIRRAAETKSLNIFTIRNIADYLYIYPSTTTARRILEQAGAVDIENCTLAECVGILRTYVEMNSYSTALARHLQPVLEACVTKIEKSCKLEGTNLTIAENGTFLSVVQAIETGDAIMRYGIFTENPSLVVGGQALIASYLSENSSFDLRTLADLYPVVVYENSYYPHFVKLYLQGDDVVWAWTCAQKFSYERNSEGNGVYTITFPAEQTHYAIIRGVQSFRRIYIYDIEYRTDPRFETYNSSGYVYVADSRTLLLKSRHKESKEIVRLVYGQVPRLEPTPAPTPERPSTSATETSTSAESVEPVSETSTQPASNSQPEAVPPAQNQGATVPPRGNETE